MCSTASSTETRRRDREVVVGRAMRHRKMCSGHLRGFTSCASAARITTKMCENVHAGKEASVVPTDVSPGTRPRSLKAVEEWKDPYGARPSPNLWERDSGGRTRGQLEKRARISEAHVYIIKRWDPHAGKVELLKAAR